MNGDPLFTAKLIKNTMGRLDVSQSDLAKHLKSRGRASELLTGKRCPSKRQKSRYYVNFWDSARIF